jgi:hypothetical protein
VRLTLRFGRDPLPESGRDWAVRLRAALKRLLRWYGLVCEAVEFIEPEGEHCESTTPNS